MLVSRFIDEIEPCSVRVQVLLEAEAIGVEAEAVDEIAASTTMVSEVRPYDPESSLLKHYVASSKSRTYLHQ